MPGGGGLKLKIGRGTARDIPHIEAVREAIGPRRALMLDANCGYDPDDALSLVDALSGLGIAWLEEPLPPGDLIGTRRLAERTNIPIAGGENAFTAEAMTELIETAGVRVLQPNVSRAGGVSGLLEIDAIAASHGVEIAPHGVGGSIVVAATLHCAPVMRAFVAFEMNRLPNPLRDDLGSAPSIDADGRAMPARAAGHGVTLDRPDIERFSQAV
jgi:D-galactarolactone cycloisomerase